MKPNVPGKPIKETQREYRIQNVIKLASNENPFGTSPVAASATKNAITKLNLYPDGQSCQLRHALADAHSLEPDQIIVGNGADGVIVQLCLAYLDEDCEVIVSQSSFPIYGIYTHVMRATLVKTPWKGYGLDLEAMAGAIREQTKVIFVCNPNNPTGTSVSKNEVEAFIAKAQDKPLIVFDETYYELVPADDFPETLAPLNKVNKPFAVNLLAQAAGVAAIKGNEFLHKTVVKNHEGRLYLYRQFESLSMRYVESHTNFVLVEIGPDAADVQQEILKKGIIVRPCTEYDLPDFLRITGGDGNQNKRFVHALEEVLEDLRH